jgi:hypothetical protein
MVINDSLRGAIPPELSDEMLEGVGGGREVGAERQDVVAR